MNRLVRITHIITEAPIMGGAQYNTFYSAREQQKCHDVEVIVGTNGPLVELCNTNGISVRVIPLRNRLLDPLGDARFLARLIRHLRRRRPDIVHTHSSKAGILGRLAAWLAGTPIIVHTIHGHEFHVGRHHAVDRAIIAVQRLWARFTDLYIPVVDALGREFVDAGICAPERVKTVVSGIDFARFPPTPSAERARVRALLGVPDDVCLVVTIGSFLPDKRYDVLLDVADLLFARRVPVVFGVLGGWGDQEQWVRAEIARRNVADRVLLWGIRDDVPEILASADIYLQTSAREGISRGLVEAMYSRLAIVASDVGGTSQVMRDRETGFLVPCADVAAAAERIIQFVNSPDLRRRMGESAHHAVAGTRSVEAMTEALESIYADLLESKGRNPSTRHL